MSPDSLAAPSPPNFKDFPAALLGTVVSFIHQLQTCTCKYLSYMYTCIIPIKHIVKGLVNARFVSIFVAKFFR